MSAIAVVKKEAPRISGIEMNQNAKVDSYKLIKSSEENISELEAKSEDNSFSDNSV